eukprot:2454701-Rhodomonas_salina.1
MRFPVLTAPILLWNPPIPYEMSSTDSAYLPMEPPMRCSVLPAYRPRQPYEMPGTDVCGMQVADVLVAMGCGLDGAYLID